MRYCCSKKVPLCAVQYSGTPVQRCPSRTTAPLKQLFFCAQMPFTLLRTPEERHSNTLYDGKKLADGRHLPHHKRPLGIITVTKKN